VDNCEIMHGSPSRAMRSAHGERRSRCGWVRLRQAL